MNIYQKLIDVRKVVPYLQKETKGYQYNYVSSSQVLSAVRAKMDEVGLLLIPRIIDVNVTHRTVDSKDKYGNLKKTTTYFTELTMEFTWVDVDNPDDTIVCHWYGQGIDVEGEKGVGKALTYAEKYFLLKTFNIATDKDDPDAFQRRTEPDNPQNNNTLNDLRNEIYQKAKELEFAPEDMVEIMEREWGKDVSLKLSSDETVQLAKHMDTLYKIKHVSYILGHEVGWLPGMSREDAERRLSELNKEQEALAR